MRATIQLINALRKAADRIETRPDDYCWTYSASCNCGILAGALGFDEPQYAGCGIWSRHAKKLGVCEVTGIGIYDVLRGMHAAGLTVPDIVEIENLSNQVVLERAGLSTKTEKDPLIDNEEISVLRSTDTAVIRYFRAQADILEEQLAEQFESRPLSLNKPVSPAGEKSQSSEATQSKPVEAGQV